MSFLSLVAPSNRSAPDPRLALPLDEPGQHLTAAIKSAWIGIRRERCWISPGKAG
jgi:hypothetical protein